MKNYDFYKKKVAVLGWGINGLDAAKYLLKEGAIVSVLDRKNKKELNFSGIDTEKIELILGPDYLKKGLREYDVIFRAPGIYRYIPEIVDAEEKGVVVTSVVKLFFDLCPSKIIGVTGTKGKGTTSTLIYETLKKDGKDVCLAGNIGVPMLELLPKLKSDSWVVLELSSFQLMDMTKSPHIAVVLNITEDHMDWHKDRKEYVKSKMRIVKYQKKIDSAVLNYDYKTSKNFSKHTTGEVYYFSKKKVVKGAYIKGGEIILDIGKETFSLGKTENLLLRGEHNWENICAASCASYLACASIQSIKSTVFAFKGLEHRLELVGEVNGREYYNDSFSTNPQTTIAAIHSFEEPLTLILGGSSKGLNYDEMGREIARSSNLNDVVLIGDIAEIIKKSINKTEYMGKIFELGKRNMEEIVKKCTEVTPKGGVVLLSPATASFDMFKDYKDRGKQFKEVVMNLKLQDTRKVRS